MEEPTTATFILALILLVVVLAAILIVGTYFLAEAWRTHKGTTKHYYAYGHGDCELRFITGGGR